MQFLIAYWLVMFTLLVGCGDVDGPSDVRPETDMSMTGEVDTAAPTWGQAPVFEARNILANQLDLVWSSATDDGQLSHL